jgi:hypothetical protein
MTQSITFPSLPQYQNYCTVADVKNLIGNVYPISNGDVADAQIQSVIANATDFIDAQTHNFFSPRRLRFKMDGNGKSRMVLPHSHVLWVNELDVYFTYPVSLSRIAHDWDINVDRPAGILSFPPYTNAPFFAPFAYTFFKSSRNVQVDAWFGWSRSIFGEVPTSADRQNYVFANPTAITNTKEAIYFPTTPPEFGPTVYLNGQKLVNTTYTLVTSIDSSANNQWEIQTDNIYYTLQVGPNGFTGIKFNSPNANTDVVTVDYDFWYIPSDIKDICAKKVAVTLLTSFATSTFQDQQFQGAVEIQSDGPSRIKYEGGQWGPQINWWDSEIEKVIRKHTRIPMPYGVGYSEDGSFF